MGGCLEAVSQAPAFRRGLLARVVQESAARLVAKNSHAEVHSCFDARARRRYCLKVVRAEGAHLAHQLRLLSSLAAKADVGGARFAAGAEGAVPAGEFAMPPILACGFADHPLHPERGLRLCVLSPWVEGVALSRIIADAAEAVSRGGRAPSLSAMLDLLRSVACSLRDAGGLDEGGRFVHQDVKPSNVIVSAGRTAPAAAAHGRRRARATLIDYDTAFVAGSGAGALSQGTRRYAAPEAVSRREGWEDPAADVFSFGALACEALTGRPPRRALRAGGPGAGAWGADPRAARALPADVREIVSACLALDPALRPSAFRLAEWMGDLSARYAGDDAACPFEGGGAAPAETPWDGPAAPKAWKSAGGARMRRGERRGGSLLRPAG